MHDEIDPFDILSGKVVKYCGSTYWFKDAGQNFYLGHGILHNYWMPIKENLHRENGPAIICADGSETWYNNGKLHRTNGPAVRTVSFNYTTGNGTRINKCWAINGSIYTNISDFNEALLKYNSENV